MFNFNFVTMKKFLLFGFLLAIVSIMATGCKSCTKSENKQDAQNEQVLTGGYDYDGVLPDMTGGVAHIQALHRQTMFTLYGGEDYAWYETRVLFNDSLKYETLAEVKVTDVTDIFQAFDPFRCQFISTNVEKGTIIPPAIPDVWVEDCDMSKLEIKLSVEEVLQRLQMWDGIIPPAIGMTLRCPLGPRRCNAQWVIGNIVDVIFVDAVTGDITNWCPAFPIPNVAGPLGEWP
jgi:hypothetical protein